jgi:hypothetical protein
LFVKNDTRRIRTHDFGLKVTTVPLGQKRRCINYLALLGIEAFSLLKHDFPEFPTASDILGPFSALDPDRKLLQKAKFDTRDGFTK